MGDSGWSRSVVYLTSESQRIIPTDPVSAHWEPDDRLRVRPSDEKRFRDTGSALEWADRRAPRIIVRVERPIQRYRFVAAGDMLFRFECPRLLDTTHYSAGQEHVIWNDEAPLPAWIRDSPETTRSRDTKYGGTVWIVHSHEQHEPGEYLGWSARTETAGGGVMTPAKLVGPDWEGDVASAILWARERAAYVILTFGPPFWAYWSAGEDIPGLSLPQWDFGGDGTGSPDGATFPVDV